MAGTKISQLTEDAIVAGDTVAIRRGASNYAGTIGDQIAAIETITAQLQTTGTAAAFSINTDSDNNATGATADLLFDNNGGTTVARLRWDEATSTFNLGYGASNHLVIDSSGNVGIGTSSPGRKLHVSDSGNTYAAISQTDATASALVIGAESGINRIYSWTTPGGSTASPLRVSVGILTAFHVATDGNFHIGGTTAPNKFTVTHDEAVNTWSSVSDASTDAVVKILGSNNATPYGLYLGYANSANNAQGIQAGDGTSALPLTLNPKGGAIMMEALPTSDPTNAGEIWNDSGTLKVSAG
jgi:hypothetical protein